MGLKLKYHVQCNAYWYQKIIVLIFEYFDNENK